MAAIQQMEQQTQQDKQADKEAIQHNLLSDAAEIVAALNSKQADFDLRKHKNALLAKAEFELFRKHIQLLNKKDAAVLPIDKKDRTNHVKDRIMDVQHGVSSLPVLALLLSRNKMNYFMPAVNHHKASIGNFLQGASSDLPGMLENATTEFGGVNMDKKIEVFLYINVTASKKSANLGLKKSQLFHLPSIYPIIKSEKETQSTLTYAATSKHAYDNHPSAVGHPLNPKLWNQVVAMLGFDDSYQVKSFPGMFKGIVSLFQNMSTYTLNNQESIKDFCQFIPNLRKFVYDTEKSIHQNYRNLKVEFSKLCPLRVGMIEGMHRTLLTSMIHEGIDANGMLTISQVVSGRPVRSLYLHQFYKAMPTVFRTPLQGVPIDDFLQEARFISLDAAEQDIVSVGIGTRDQIESAFSQIDTLYKKGLPSFDSVPALIFAKSDELKAMHQKWMDAVTVSYTHLTLPTKA